MRLPVELEEMNEQARIGAGEIESRNSKESLRGGAWAPKIITGQGSYAKVAAQKLREGYTTPEAVSGALWIPLSQEMFALVDEADHERVNQKIWTALRNETVTYAVFRDWPSKKIIFLHRWLLGLRSVREDGVLVDHKNSNGLDCRRDNLRICSKTENNRHARKWRSPTASKFKGVFFDARYRFPWGTQITRNGKRVFLERFQTENEAALAYNAAADRLFGEFAVFNIVP